MIDEEQFETDRKRYMSHKWGGRHLLKPLWQMVLSLIVWTVLVALVIFFIGLHYCHAAGIEVRCWDKDGNEGWRAMEWCATYRDGVLDQIWNVPENHRELARLTKELEAMGTRGLIAIDIALHSERWLDI